MKILVCYAAPTREFVVAQRLASAAKEYVSKYFPKDFLQFYWLNTEKQNLDKFLNKEENQDVIAVFIPEGMKDVIQTVRKRKIKVETYGEKDAPVVHSTFGQKTKHLLWQRFETYLLDSFETVYKINRKSLEVKVFSSEKARLSDLTDFSCEYFSNPTDALTYLEEAHKEETRKLEKKMQELKDQMKLLDKNKEDAVNSINNCT